MRSMLFMAMGMGLIACKTVGPSDHGAAEPAPPHGDGASAEVAETMLFVADPGKAAPPPTQITTNRISITFPQAFNKGLRFHEIIIQKKNATDTIFAPMAVDGNVLSFPLIDFAPSTAYTIKIPANAITYANGSPNADIEIAISTPASMTMPTVLSAQELNKLGGALPPGSIITKADNSKLTSPIGLNLATPPPMTDDQVYNQVYYYAATKSYADIPLPNTNEAQIRRIVPLMQTQHPYLFNGPAKMSWSYQNLSGGQISATLKFDVDSANLAKIQKAAAQALTIARQLYAIGGNKTTVKSYLQLAHDWVVNNTAYDLRYVNHQPVPNESYSAYGVFINKVAVCQGYSAAMELLGGIAGVATITVAGSGNAIGQVSKKDHAWNKIFVTPSPLFIDATWDDPVTPNGKQILQQTYFMVTSTVLAKDHSWIDGSYPQKYAFAVH